MSTTVFKGERQVKTHTIIHVGSHGNGDLLERVLVWAQGGHANTLTSQEQQEGWILLFDGKTLDKWNVTPELAEVYKVVDGAIKADLSDAGGTMLTKDTFDNFVLKVEFRAHPDINSGIILQQPPTQGRRRPRLAKNRLRLLAAAPATSCRSANRNPGNYSSGDFLTGKCC